MRERVSTSLKLCRMIGPDFPITGRHPDTIFERTKTMTYRDAILELPLLDLASPQPILSTPVPQS
jgi:hypothetical protein